MSVNEFSGAVTVKGATILEAGLTTTGTTSSTTLTDGTLSINSGSLTGGVNGTFSGNFNCNTILPIASYVQLKEELRIWDSSSLSKYLSLSYDGVGESSVVQSYNTIPANLSINSLGGDIGIGKDTTTTLYVSSVLSSQKINNAGTFKNAGNLMERCTVQTEQIAAIAADISASTLVTNDVLYYTLTGGSTDVNLTLPTGPLLATAIGSTDLTLNRGIRRKLIITGDGTYKYDLTAGAGCTIIGPIPSNTTTTPSVHDLIFYFDDITASAETYKVIISG